MNHSVQMPPIYFLFSLTALFDRLLSGKSFKFGDGGLEFPRSGRLESFLNHPLGNFRGEISGLSHLIFLLVFDSSLSDIFIGVIKGFNHLHFDLSIVDAAI